MTILLSFENKGKLELFDDNVLNHIKSFLSNTPNEKFVEIHKQMIELKYKPYRKFREITFWKITYRQYTNFSMESINNNNGLTIPLVVVDQQYLKNYKNKKKHKETYDNHKQNDYKQKVKYDNYRQKIKRFMNKRK